MDIFFQNFPEFIGWCYQPENVQNSSLIVILMNNPSGIYQVLLPPGLCDHEAGNSGCFRDGIQKSVTQKAFRASLHRVEN